MPPPPIRAVCRHEFGQRVDIIRAKHNTCLNNTNLGSVTAVNGTNSATPQNMDPGKFLLLPLWTPENVCYYPPPPTESILAKLGLPPPPQMDVGPYAYGRKGYIARMVLRIVLPQKRNRSRPKRKFMVHGERDMAEVEVTEEDTVDRNNWRRKIRCVDP